MDEGQILSTFTASGLIFYVMRFLKTKDSYGRFVKAFPSADRTVHRLIAGLGSLIAALGITWAYQGDASTGWMITIAIPNLETLIDAAWKFVQVFTGQQVIYDSTRRPAAMPHDVPVTGKPS